MLTIITIAEPHKPWQRGMNENTNDILRFFFPKGFDFRTISQAQLDTVVDLINNRRAENDYKVNLKTEIMIEDIFDKVTEILKKQAETEKLLRRMQAEEKDEETKK